jgi:hypothetical protein
MIVWLLDLQQLIIKNIKMEIYSQSCIQHFASAQRQNEHIRQCDCLCKIIRSELSVLLRKDS